MTTIYVTRHGQTKWNLEGRMQGRQDSPLTPLGEKQARWLGARLKEVTLSSIHTSSSGRTKQTAEQIRGERELPIIENHSWKEIDLGPWEGRLKNEVEKEDPDRFHHFWNKPASYLPDDGETYQDVIQRAGNELEKLALSQEGKSILLVTHAVVLKALLAYVSEKSLEDFWSGAYMHSTSLTILEKENGRWKVKLEGDTTHYPS
ncbi:histidine phosphatase family protein [Halobacillus mangrovi]|uniref:Histidine phosphatase family protein n=1 Tax=Halobacillus mangrovi TaxID=402384 RepID=A0A1W5ZQH5_9BACI|nr:histidine phosphatase family protein [Halobacillus mangrovi]ARI75550.1 histidine phosphatase family protein [Halobacillus mangrovi]